MDLLLNPNVAYLVLVVGFLIGILALVAPGTGFLELGALFVLVLAGYAIYNLPVNLWALGVLALGVVPFYFAVRLGPPQRSQRLALLVVSTVLVVAGSLFLFRGEDWRPVVHPLLAFVVSVFITGFLWIAARRSLEAIQLKPVHNPDDLVGQVGETRTPIHQEGSVYIGGEMWSARSTQPIPSGTPVRVIRRDGFILEVEPLPVQQQA